ncbi:MAG: anti-sigma factor [Dehalococcoidia bacterium]|nr:anti-sigma factor [Dehalococcoidia bacterium]
MSRKIVEENYESYVLGALPEAERDEFEAHLADYPDEFAEFVEAADTMALFAMALDRTPVPDRVLKTLLSRVEADMGYEADSGRQQQAVQVHDDAGSGLLARVGTLLAGRWAHPAMGMAVVAILLLVAGGLWLDNRLGSVEQSASDMQKVDEMLAAVIEGQTELASQVEAGAASDAQIMDMVKEQRDLAYMEANPDRLVSMLRPADAAAKGRGMMVTSSDGRDCLLAVLDMPALSGGEVYQVWLVKDDVMTSGGVFTVDSTGYGQMVIRPTDPMWEFDSIGITVEPAGGSSDPTGRKVLLGDL